MSGWNQIALVEPVGIEDLKGKILKGVSMYIQSGSFSYFAYLTLLGNQKSPTKLLIL